MIRYYQTIHEVEKILHFLCTKFDYIATSIEEAKEVEDIIVDWILNFIQAHKQRSKKQDLEKTSLQNKNFSPSQMKMLEKKGA